MVQHGWYHLGKGTYRDLNFKIFPVRRFQGSPVNFDPADKHGQQSFDDLVEALKPDIVFTVTDYDRIGHLISSIHRHTYQLVAYLPLDNFPPPPGWAEAIRGPDKLVYYTEFAKLWGETLGVQGPDLPHGVDTKLFKPADPEVRQAIRKRLFQMDDDGILIGTCGRNLPRKQLQLLIEAMAYLRHGAYSKCSHCGNLVSHDFELPARVFNEPPACPTCNQEALVPGKAWPQLKANLHTDPDETPRIPIRHLINFWRADDCIYLNRTLKTGKGDGVPDDQLASTYQCLDAYVHTASGGGWELPPLEAAACGLPIVAVDAPAHGQWIRGLPGRVMVRGNEQWCPLSSGYRIYATAAAVAQGILTYLEDPERMRKDGEVNHPFVHDHYDWSAISLEWEKLFLEMLNPETRVAGWRVLREV
ncbi:MAG: hypothetical protein GTO63_25965 [Anaerolineae bacterium]|nr:hypothetical protein [Anaerolineae bacterium]NIN98189.1 hypothetical protein [Anaerolineae bacterium]NIQ81113.1 hypothetical protein [Anaerolineae bacterium]